MTKPMRIPELKSEQAEARWYDENQSALLAQLERAAKDGSLRRGTLARRGLTPTTTIRLDPSDIELAKLQAEAHGLRYQTYLKMIIHKALLLESAKNLKVKKTGKR